MADSESQVLTLLQSGGYPLARVLEALTKSGWPLQDSQAVLLGLLERGTVVFDQGLLRLMPDEPYCHWCEHHHSGERRGVGPNGPGCYCPGPLLEPDPSWKQLDT